MTTSAAPRYRDALPQLGDALFLTDGGIETTLPRRHRASVLRRL
jgi:hypothetical protein